MRSYLVDPKGENSIVVATGANAKLTPADIDAAQALIKTASVVLLQLEIPVACVLYAIELCHRLGVYVILDPAPVPPQGLPRAMWQVDLFTPNPTEAEMLTGLEPAPRVKRKRIVDPKQVATELLSRGPKSVVLKLGAKGALVLDRAGRIERIKPFNVKVVDTTAAGDAFTAGLAVAHSEGRDLIAAAEFANAAGALCCEGFGAQPALPTRKLVDKLMATRNTA